MSEGLQGDKTLQFAAIGLVFFVLFAAGVVGVTLWSDSQSAAVTPATASDEQQAAAPLAMETDGPTAVESVAMVEQLPAEVEEPVAEPLLYPGLDVNQTIMMEAICKEFGFDDDDFLNALRLSNEKAAEWNNATDNERFVYCFWCALKLFPGHDLSKTGMIAAVLAQDVNTVREADDASPTSELVAFIATLDKEEIPKRADALAKEVHARQRGRVITWEAVKVVKNVDEVELHLQFVNKSTDRLSASMQVELRTDAGEYVDSDDVYLSLEPSVLVIKKVYLDGKPATNYRTVVRLVSVTGSDDHFAVERLGKATF